ncbi:MAG: SpoIIE family protein phosphatase [Pseudomonadota bacterium]
MGEGMAAGALPSYRDTGQRVQRAMYPPTPMGLGALRLRYSIEQARCLRGDLVDYFVLAEHYACFYVADVSRLGPTSAFVPVLLKNLSRRLRREYRRSMLDAPEEALAWFQQGLGSYGITEPVSMFLGIAPLRGEIFRYAAVGSTPLALLATPRGRFVLDATSDQSTEIPGNSAQALQSRPAPLAPGDALAVFTGPATDSANSHHAVVREALLSPAASFAEQWQALLPSGELDCDRTALFVERV